MTNASHDFEEATLLVAGSRKGIGCGCGDTARRGGAEMAVTFRLEEGSVSDLRL